VTVSLDIECREYNGRWYYDIRAWNVVKKSEAQTSAATSPAAPLHVTPADVDNMLINGDISADASSGDEGLPF